MAAVGHCREPAVEKERQMTAQLTFGLDCTTVVKAGPGIRALVPPTIAGLGCRRVAMITDQGLVAAGVVEQVREAFGAHDISLVGIFDGVRQDNDTRDINECAAWYREIDADGLLAVGGGSVLDTAKCVKVMLGMHVSDVNELVNEAGVISYSRPQAKPLGIPHVSLPTTAGTGAELSQGAALFDEQEHKKILLFHHYMNSDFAFLDPELTVSLPPTITAETAFDALSHCLEAFFSPRHNSIADALALRSARLILDNLPTAVDRGDDIVARMELMTASAMAVVASISGRGAAPIHNFADAVGPVFRISHGRANAVYVPIVMQHLPSHYLPRIRMFAHGLGIFVDAKSDAELLDEVISAFASLQAAGGIEPKLDIEVDSDRLAVLHAEVKEDPAGLQFPLPDDVIRTCLEASLTVKHN